MTGRAYFTHLDLVRGLCTAEEYVADLRARVDAKLAVTPPRTRHPGEHAMETWLERVFRKPESKP